LDVKSKVKVMDAEELNKKLSLFKGAQPENIKPTEIVRKLEQFFGKAQTINETQINKEDSEKVNTEEELKISTPFVLLQKEINNPISSSLFVNPKENMKESR